MTRHLTLAGIIMTVSYLASTAPAAETKLVVNERLNVGWTNEWLSLPLEAAKGQCVPGSLVLTGPGGRVPVQLDDVQWWPDSNSIKSARAVFVVDALAPRGAETFTLTYGKSAAPVGPATDLKVTAGKDRVDITTTRCGIRLPLGGRVYDSPVPIKDLPGPFQAAQLGAGGAWAGGSQCYGEAPATAWSAVLTDSGPVFARAVVTYQLAGSNAVTLTATVRAGDTAVRWDMAVQKDLPESGVEFRLPPVPGATQAVTLRGYGQWSRSDRIAPLAPKPEPFTWLSPDTSIANIFPDCSWAIKLVAADKRELRVLSRDPAAWADAVVPMTYGGQKSWNLEMIEKSWNNWKRKRIPLTYAADGTVGMRVSLAQGQRKWSVSADAPVVGDALARVQAMILDWPDDSRHPHPHHFVDKADLDDVWKRAATDPDLQGRVSQNGVLAYLRKPADQRTPAQTDAVLREVRKVLALRGNFDVMRQAIQTISTYDAVVDSGLLSPEERALFRAQAAYLAYQMADPQTWDIERGYHSGNPNMSCSYVLSLGVIAATLRDHPMAGEWAQTATRWMDRWLTDEVGPNGEWIPEGSHYGYVSLEPLVVYAVAAQRAGFHDFTNDPRLKKVLLYFAKTMTPRDPQHNNLRVTGAWGRGTSGDGNGVYGVAARMTAKSDHAFSKVMQWIWNEGGCPSFMADGRLGGFEPFYQDRRLPAQAPVWSSDLFPNLGVFARAAFNTSNESFLIFLSHTDSHRNLDVWTPGIGGISQWFGRGKPLGTCFTIDTGYACRHELLRDGVRLARNWGEGNDPKVPFGHYTQTEPQAVALQVPADYLRSRFEYTTVDNRDWFPNPPPPAYPRVRPAKEPKLDWTRQLLFIRDPDPAGPAYIVLRDTTLGGQPTAWQFWTLSDKVGAADQTRNAEAFLADKPGNTLVPARELPGGNRYTALGQFGVDVEYFVASPSGTPRHTLRYGGDYAPDRNVHQYQDMLHLQQPGDGVYYVAIFPRPRNEAAPEFAVLADGKIIRVSGAFGTDYAFLATETNAAAADEVRVAGTAASIQVRGATTVLSLGAAGEVHWKKVGLKAPCAAVLRVEGDALTLTLPENNPGGSLTVVAPGKWAVKGRGTAVKLTQGPDGLTLTVPEGGVPVTLVRE